jgi:hypothetical protein
VPGTSVEPRHTDAPLEIETGQMDDILCEYVHGCT